MGNNVLGGSSFTGWATSTTSKDLVGVVTIENTTEATFCVPGIYDWTSPITGTASVVCIGGGGGGGVTTYGGSLAYKNSISVTQGTTYKVVVGAGSSGLYAEDSYMLDSSVVTDISIARQTFSGEVIQTSPGAYIGNNAAGSEATSIVTTTSSASPLLTSTGTLPASYIGYAVTHSTSQIPPNTYIIAISGTTITLSNNTNSGTSSSGGTLYVLYSGSGWLVPDGVTSISAVCVGGGGGGQVAAGGGGSLTFGTISVTPGTYVNYFVGAGGSKGYYVNGGTSNLAATSGGASSVISTPTGITIKANGGGGANTNSSTSYPGGGGGAAGYAGPGGAGAKGVFTGTSVTGGAGGVVYTNPGADNFGSYAGGAGGNSYVNATGSITSGGNAGAPSLTGYGGGGGGATSSNLGPGGGGGVGLYGLGASGAGGQPSAGVLGGGGGSGGGSGGGTGSSGVGTGGTYGGGGANNTNGQSGAIRFVYPGNTNYFPSTNVSSTVPTAYFSNITLSSNPGIVSGTWIMFQTAISNSTISTSTPYFVYNATGNSLKLVSTNNSSSLLDLTSSNISQSSVTILYSTVKAKGGLPATIPFGNLGTAYNNGGPSTNGGGGGAAGYTTVGGTGSVTGLAGSSGSGGGGNANIGGGGVGLYGSVSVTATGGTVVSVANGGGGAFGYTTTTANGGLFGGAGGTGGTGAGGAVRIIWGGKTFPLNAIPTTNTIITNGSTTSSPSILPASTSVTTTSGPTGNTYATVTLNNNPTAIGKAEFTVAGLIASPPTGINSSTNSFAITTTNSDGTKASAQPTNNTQSRIDNTNDASLETNLQSNAMPDNDKNSKRSDQNLSTTDAVANRIGWTG